MLTFLYRILKNRVTDNYKRMKMRACGSMVSFGRKVYGTWENIEIGNNVFLGDESYLLSTKAIIHIGDDVMFGPRVTVITGNHRIDLISKKMIEITDDEKLPENDMDVIFEGDNWCGANSTILKGVRIGYGAVVGAGAVVTRDVPPMCIVAGVPAKVIGKRGKK